MTSRVGLFIPNLDLGGAQRVAVNLSTGLVKRGCETEIIVACKRGRLIESVDSEVNIVSLGVSRTVYSVPYLVWRMNRIDYDAIISFMGYVNICAIVSSKASLSNHVSILTEHTTVSAQSGAQGGRSYAVQHLSKILYPMSDAVVTVSEGVAEDLKEEIGLSDHQVCTIYNPVVTDELHQLSGIEVSHPWIECEEPLILGVGRLIRDKNFGLLLKAFKRLNEELSARLIILGEGRERSRLERLSKRLGVQERVAFPGFKTNPYRYMAASDLVALSSDREGFGNVLVEAMACGTPVVSTNCRSGPSEILEEGKWGSLVPVGNALELARAIQSTLNDPPSPRLLKKRAEDFTDRKAAEKYISLIEKFS